MAHTPVTELLNSLEQGVCLISPMRLDARLFNKPKENPAGKRGLKPKIWYAANNIRKAFR
jgi:hypothetical protein